MPDATSEPPCLVLTALRPCWPEDGPVTLLGPWCERYSEGARPGERHTHTLPGPWQSRAALRHAHLYVTALQARLLPPLAGALNRLHGTEHTARYWGLMLGAWLLSFLPALYERYRSLDAAYRREPGFSTCGLSRDCFVTPTSTVELPRRIIGDHYNLQLYTRLLEGMGKSCAACRVSPPAADPGVATGDWRRRVRWVLSTLGRRIPGEHSVLAHTSCFPRHAELALAWRLRGRFRRLFVAGAPVPGAPLRPDARAALREAVVPDDEFTRLLRDILPFELPICFVEGYPALVATAADFPPPPAAILSANAWYYDEPFKHWAASAREQGSRLLGVQHGGNYGGGNSLPSEAFEIGLVDRYYTWGWRKSRYGDAAWPMPAPKLIGRPVLGASNARHGILLGTTHLTRYPLNFITSVTEFEDYLRAHRTFATALTPALRRVLRVRPHREDFGWDIAARWHDLAPEVPLESWRTPFADSLRDCRIYVCDHHSTTFLEALGADKPTVLFWDPAAVDLAPEYADRYAALRAVGILHDAPDRAAAHLDEVYRDVEGWWRQEAVQRARRRLCDVLGRTAPDALDRWEVELRAQTDRPRPPGLERRPERQ